MNTDWSILNCCEVQFAWELLECRIFALADKYIPKITIKSEFQPPWFDSETFEVCIAKERFRKKFKQTKKMKDELKFTNSRRDF